MFGLRSVTAPLSNIVFLNRKMYSCIESHSIYMVIIKLEHLVLSTSCHGRYREIIFTCTKIWSNTYKYKPTTWSYLNAVTATSKISWVAYVTQSHTHTHFHARFQNRRWGDVLQGVSYIIFFLCSAYTSFRCANSLTQNHTWYVHSMSI